MDRRTLLKSVAAARLVPTSAAAEQPARLPLPTTVESHGARLFYRQWGTGRPVVFVHSWSANADLWQYQMIHLSSNGLRCIAYDQRGHGRSSDPGQGYDYDTLADDLAAIMEKLDVSGASLVGHSMGCGTIVRYLSRHGAGRVSRMALVGPTLPYLLKTADNPDGIDQAVGERLRAAFSHQFPKWLADNSRPFFTPDTPQAMVDWGIWVGLQTSLKAIVDCNRAVLETDFRRELTRIGVPTLIVHGDADASAPLERTAKRTAALVRGSELKIYEGAPHGLMLTHIDRLNADLLAFV